MTSIGPTFEAKWKGTCKACDNDWQVGDTIGFLDDLVHCGQCIEDAREQEEWERYFDRG